MMKYVQKIAAVGLLLLLSLSLTTSCSDDIEEEDLIIVSQTFLEKNDKSEWALSHEDLVLYIRLNKDALPHIEQWTFQSNSDCFVYIENIFNPGDYCIKEHSATSVVIDCDPVLGDCDRMTFSREGNILQVDIRMSEWETATVYFHPADMSLDSLNLCAFDDENKGLFYFYLLTSNSSWVLPN